MASWARQVRTTTWVEYTLSSPTNWGEVGKVLAALRQEIGDECWRDDIVQVEAGDDEIVFRFEIAAGAS